MLIWLLAILTVYLGAKRAAEDDREQNYVIRDDKEKKKQKYSGRGTRAGGGSGSVRSSNGRRSGGRGPSRLLPTDDDELEYGSLPDAADEDIPSRSRMKGGLPASFSDEDDELEESKYDYDKRSSYQQQDEEQAQSESTPLSTGRTSISSSTGAGAGVDERAGDGSDSLDISLCQAVLFVIVSSVFLIFLYFVDAYLIVSVIYLTAAAVATALVSFEPLFRAVLGPADSADNCCGVFEAPPTRSGRRDRDSDKTWCSYLCCCGWCGSIHIDCAMIAAVLAGAGLAVIWYIFKNDMDEIWVVQDLLGINVCILFLTSIRLPNLKVAATLLILAFCYDVFFVFISPYVFDNSVMLKVAEGGSSSGASAAGMCW